MYYCNVKCQRKAWKEHKGECGGDKGVVKENKGNKGVKEKFTSMNDFIDIENIGVGNFTNVVKARWK